MATIYSSALTTALAAIGSKVAYLQAIIDALGASRTVTFKRAASGDPWSGTTFYAAPVTGAMTITSFELRNLGTVGPHTVRANADLSTGFAVMRIEGGGAFMQGTVGLSGATGYDGLPVDFVLRKSPNGAYGIMLNSAKFGAPAHLTSAYLVAPFKLQNWSASSSRTLARVGMPFRKGDIPAGMKPEVRRAGGAPIVAQFDERATWPDGSLRFAVCHLRDADVAGSTEREYQVFAVEGAYDNTGATSLASVVSGNALTVELSSFAQWNGTTSATRGAGAALATLATHAAVPTRVTKVHSGPVCEGWVVWGMVKDGAAGAGAEDAHLKAIWHVDVWKDGGGAVIDTEFAAEMAQDWWGVADKYRLDYTATLKRNGTTVQAYAGVQQPYGGHSLVTVRMQDDNNHARRHWVTAVPTLAYAFDRAYWKASRMVPPYDTTVAATANAAATYVPGGAIQHRAAIDGTGAYIGRGMLPGCDAKTFLRQTPADFRNSRTNAFAGLHVPFHFRDERTRTRAGESADVANTLVPLIWDPKPTSASTFVGLPDPKHAYRKSGEAGGYQVIAGGKGVWATGTDDASHAVQYCAFAYLVEGERYFLDAMIDLAHYNAHDRNGNDIDGRPYAHWYSNTAARAEMSIPSTRWAAIPDLSGQERSLGWSMNLLGYASALSPDNDPQAQYMKAWNQHCGDFLQAAVTYTPTSLKASGTGAHSVGGTNATVRSPWMGAFNIQCCANNYLMTEVLGCKNYADLLIRGTTAVAVRNKYDLVMYRWAQSPIAQLYSGGNFLAANRYLVGPETVTASSNVLTYDGGQNIPPQFKNGDLCYFLTRSDAGAVTALPTGYTEGTPLYIVGSSGATFQVSLTVGGAAMTVPNGSYRFAGEYSNRAGIAVAEDPPYLPPPDSYAPIHEAAFAMAERAGLPSATPGTFAAVRAHLANVDRASDPRWSLSI